MEQPLSALDNITFLNVVNCPECGEQFHESALKIHRHLTHKYGVKTWQHLITGQACECGTEQDSD